MTEEAGRGRSLRLNDRNVADGLDLLRSVKSGTAAAVFCDPQYRGLLDKLAYGNEGTAREQRRAKLPQMSAETIEAFLRQIARSLMPSGHLFFWADKFGIGSGSMFSFNQPGKLEIVDLIHWNKLRPGMGRRSRSVSEYLMVLQKHPVRAKGRWTDHSIRDSWSESVDRSQHPHAKPYQLTERLIRATTKKGDLVVDPCAGSYVVLEACRLTGRTFFGCDLIEFSSGESR